jgi:DNA-binding transcriptional LysR family regulator
MNLRGIDLNLLPVFEAIYTERSLTRASEVLHTTQPALSNALVRLRRAFGDPLFIRSGRGMSPTPEAEQLIRPVRDAMTRLRSGLDRGQGFDPSSSERAFNVAAGDVATSALAPALARQLADSAPRVRFFFHQIERAAVPNELAARRLDLAVEIPALAQADLESRPFIEDPYVCVLRRGHPDARPRLTLDRLLALHHVAVSRRRGGRTVVDLALNRMGERLRPVMRFPHYAAAFHVIETTDFALIAPLSLARLHDVEIRELPLDGLRLVLHLYWRRDTDRDPACVWAREQLMSSVERRDLNG